MNNIEDLVAFLIQKHRCIKDIKFIAYYEEPAYVLLVKMKWYYLLFVNKEMLKNILLFEISKEVREPIKFDVVFI